MVLREEMYFEPRTISPGGSIRWFGATYSADPIRPCAALQFYHKLPSGTGADE